MPRPRFERAAPELRERILDAAAAEFAAEGYEGAALSRILGVAGLSKGAFYYYFDDKADLAGAVLEREMLRLLAALGELPRPDTVDEFWGVVRRLGDVSLAHMREQSQRRDLLGQLGMAFARDPQLRTRVGPMFQEARQRIGVLWQRGQEIGAVRTDLPLAALLAILEAMKLAAVGALLPADRLPSTAEWEAFTSIHRDLLRRVAEPAAAAPTPWAPTPEVHR